MEPSPRSIGTNPGGKGKKNMNRNRGPWSQGTRRAIIVTTDSHAAKRDVKGLVARLTPASSLVVSSVDVANFFDVVVDSGEFVPSHIPIEPVRGPYPFKKVRKIAHVSTRNIVKHDG